MHQFDSDRRLMGIFESIKEMNIFTRSRSKTKLPVIVGIPGIDAQHRTLFRLCETLLRRLKKESFSKEIVTKSFNEIIDHLKNHFSTEENLFELIAYPKAEEHKAEHSNILEQILREETVLKNSDRAEAAYFISVFQETYLNHITVFDKPYTLHIEKLVSLGKKFKITTLKAQTLAK